MCDGGYTEYHCPICHRRVPWSSIDYHFTVTHPDALRGESHD